MIRLFVLGPSYAIDTACSSSLFGLQQALMAIRTGQCDSAIVAGSNLLLKPTSSLQFHRLSMLSPQGTCKAFDVTGRRAGELQSLPFFFFFFFFTVARYSGF